ncbi:MAG: carboxypeptidase M32 [Pirellulaceae bacterium]|jgi:carboxypeptidase Taq|nr:carboxypeptidase M32 [Pirellulaceae bacterium]MDP7015598.1 carboxypeptidase M32 [Pirellulaceae bacterium]
MTSEAFGKLVAHARETGKFSSILALIEWDERTIMPSQAGSYRAEQVTSLSGFIHARRTAAEVGAWLDELRDVDWENGPHGDEASTVRELRRDYERQTKLPRSLVEALAGAAVRGQQAWVEARRNDDFSEFLPTLETIVSLRREEAEALGYESSIYDPLLDAYEPGERTEVVAGVLAALKTDLAPLVAAIADSGRTAPVDLLHQSFPIDEQEEFGRSAARRIGFDFERGRLDVTHHPFCATMGPSDCRITTRYDKMFLNPAFFGTLHEAGHGIYEQGLRDDQFELPPGSYASLGIHESQSRMWENQVGRSRAFWEHLFPAAQQRFSSLANANLDDFYFAINDVRPSLIRVEADEATYNLHIIVRFELEQAIMGGDLPLADLPQAWREKYRDALGIEPPSDADGVLQDVHWSAGLIGYFPTYALGNLYAAQFFAHADEQLGGLDEQFARGDFEPLREWLREKIHRRGRCLTAAELVVDVTGEPLSHHPFMTYLQGKLGPLYGI